MLLLNAAAAVFCAHGPGRVAALPRQTFARIEGLPILTKGDTLGRPVAGCPPTPPLKPCLVTIAETEGHSELVRIDGQPVLLDTLSGITSGDPPGAVDYTARSPGQQLVRET